MPVLRRDRLSWPLLNALCTCTARQLGIIGRPVCEFPIVFGASPPPADNCSCTCDHGGQGTAWARLVSEDAAPTGPVGACDTPWNVTIETGVYRCWPTLDQRRQPPTSDDYTKATAGLVDDAAALRRGLSCCTWIAEKDIPWSRAQITPLGPSGGCVGVTLTATIVMTGDCCPELDGVPR